MMEELVRSSMTPGSASITPQEDEQGVMEQSRLVTEQPLEQSLEQPLEQPSEPEHLAQVPEQSTTQQTPIQTPINAEDFFTQPAPAKSKSD